MRALLAALAGAACGGALTYALTRPAPAPDPCGTLADSLSDGYLLDAHRPRTRAEVGHAVAPLGIYLMTTLGVCLGGTLPDQDEATHLSHALREARTIESATAAVTALGARIRARRGSPRSDER